MATVFHIDWSPFGLVGHMLTVFHDGQWRKQQNYGGVSQQMEIQVANSVVFPLCENHFFAVCTFHLFTPLTAQF